MDIVVGIDEKSIHQTEGNTDDTDSTDTHGLGVSDSVLCVLCALCGV